MVKIPIPSNMRHVPLDNHMSNPAQISMSLPGQTIGKAGHAWQGAVASIGSAFGELAGRIEKTTNDTNDANYRTELSAFSRELDYQHPNEVQEDGTGWEAYGEKYRTKQQELSAKYPVSGRRKEAREIHAADSYHSKSIYALKKKQAAQAGVFKRNTENTIGLNEDRLRKDPNEEYLKDTLSNTDALIDAQVGTVLNPTQAAQLKRKSRERHNGAYWQGRIAKDPIGALKELQEFQSKRQQPSSSPSANGGDDIKFLEGKLSGGAATRKDSVSGLVPQMQTRTAAMMRQADADGLKGLTIHSAYRSKEKQRELFENKIRTYTKQGLSRAAAIKKARKRVAPPGRSKHNSGEAIDMQYNGKTLGKPGTEKAVAWVKKNVGKFGLHQRMSWEPWQAELNTKASYGGTRQGSQAKATPSGNYPKLAPNVKYYEPKQVVSVLTTTGKKRKASGWAARNSTWRGLNPYQKAAAMSLMEANNGSKRSVDAKNALGAMINRAAKGGEHLGAHVSNKIYQPTFEPAQERRLSRILASKEFKELTGWAERRAQGQEEDPVGGATHFLAEGKVMESLERRQPNKYLNWGPRGQNWSGYSYKTKQYKNQTLVDGSHAFLAPEGSASVRYSGQQSGTQVAQANTGTMNDAGAPGTNVVNMQGQPLQPANIAPELQNSFNAYSGMAPKNRSRLLDYARRAALQAYSMREKQDNKEAKAAQAESYKSAVDLIASGKLTPEWVQSQRDVLTGSQYKQLMSAANGTGEGKTDRGTYIDLITDAADKPDETREAAVEAYRNGKINKADLNKLITMTNAKENGVELPNYTKTTRSYIKNSLKPGGFLDSFNPEKQRAQQKALMDFEEWAQATPKATLKEQRGKAEELIGHYGQEAEARVQAQMPLPFEFNDPSEITEETTTAAIKALLDKVRAGTMDAGDANKRIKDLRAWFTLMKNKASHGQ